MNDIPRIRVELNQLPQTLIAELVIDSERMKRNMHIAIRQMEEDGTLDELIQQNTKEAIRIGIEQAAQGWKVREAVEKLVLQGLNNVSNTDSKNA